MKHQVVLAHADSGCFALIINQIVVAESDLTKDSIKLVKGAARETSVALRVPLIECTFVIPEEIDGNWEWNEVLHLLLPALPGLAQSSLVEVTQLDELAEFERAMRKYGCTSLDFQKARSTPGLTFLSRRIEEYWQFWRVRAKIAEQTVAPYVTVLQELAQVDGSALSDRDVEVLATRVRTSAVTALQLSGVANAREAAAKQYAAATNTAKYLEGKAKYDFLSAAKETAREEGFDPDHDGQSYIPSTVPLRELLPV